MRTGPRRVPQTTLVAIGDEEYYGPELAARKPLRRDYLARLVTRIAAAEPRLIAVDVDLRSPVPSGTSADFDDYADENRLLVAALCDAQLRTDVVISKAVYADEVSGVVAQRNIYELPDYPCQVPGGRITAAYLALPVDLRRVPLTLRLADGSEVDSLALATARALAPRQYPEALVLDELPYGRFRSPAEFTRVDARHVLDGSRSSELKGQIVLIFGDWHVLAKGQGSSVVDTFRTPVGIAGGAYVHASLIETLLAAEYTNASPSWIVVAAEVGIALWLAVVFAFPSGLGRKLAYLLLTTAALYISAWLSFQLFAIFFDILPLLFAMYLHAVADQVEEWRLLAGKAHA
jgi:CHASE2 domain-containing sensor protein